MPGLGTIVNAVAIIVGALIGVLAGARLPERVHGVLIKAAGLAAFAIGIKMFLESQQVVIVIISMVLGGIVGEIIDIESLLEAFGGKVKSLIRTDNKMFLEAFVTTSLLYCVGPMAILGCISEGINGRHDILLTKSILDGTVSIAFAASLGIGVLFSFIPVILYQGAITIMALVIGNIFTTSMISELSAAGGLLIMGIGVNLLALQNTEKRIPIGNLLPAIFFAPLLVWICQVVGI